MRLQSVYPVIGLLVVGLVVLGIICTQVFSPDDRSLLGMKRTNVKSALRPEPPPEDFVGGQSCRRCHQLIWERYQSHPMSQSAAATGDATPLEDFNHHPSFTASTPIGEIAYDVEISSNGQFHCETLVDPKFGQVFDQRVPIEYVIGSGRHGRSYILAQNECLFMSPMTWYSELGKWDLSPSYRAFNDIRFERRILQNCLVCHTDRVSINRDEPHRFPTPAILEPKISCERCHGPGAGHIAYHETRSQSVAKVSTDLDPIVNPVKLDFERRESVCWQCHFGVENRLPRYGRLDSDFRPGMNFDDIWVTFVRGNPQIPNRTARVASHVEQSRSSVCSQRSNGNFGCLSCHDPHFAPPTEEKVRFYREKCLECHRGQSCTEPADKRLETTKEDSCIVCHMPAGDVDGVPHTSRTDHRVLRRPQLAINSDSDSALAIFIPNGRELPQNEQDRAWGITLAKIAYLQTNSEIADAALQKLAVIQPEMADDTMLLEWLGVCEQILGRHESARARWHEILRQHPRNEDALRRLADLSIAEPNPAAARDAIELYLDVNPWQSNYQIRLAVLHADTGNLKAAISCAQESIRVNPTAAMSHRVLYELYRRRGDQLAAEIEWKLTQRLTPR